MTAFVASHFGASSCSRAFAASTSARTSSQRSSLGCRSSTGVTSVHLSTSQSTSWSSRMDCDARTKLKCMMAGSRWNMLGTLASGRSVASLRAPASTTSTREKESSVRPRATSHLMSRSRTRWRSLASFQSRQKRTMSTSHCSVKPKTSSSSSGWLPSRAADARAAGERLPENERALFRTGGGTRRKIRPGESRVARGATK